MAFLRPGNSGDISYIILIIIGLYLFTTSGHTLAGSVHLYLQCFPGGLEIKSRSSGDNLVGVVAKYGVEQKGPNARGPFAFLV